MKFLSFLFIVLLIFSVQSCSKKDKCEKNNTGSIFIDNDDPFIPPGGTDFFLETGVKIGTLEKGYVGTFDGLPIGDHEIYVLYGTDTLYYESIFIVECQTLSYHTASGGGASDRSLKQGITPLQGALQNLSKLQVYSYEYDQCPEYKQFLSKGNHFGFMAQELEKVYPSFTLKDKEGFYHVKYEELIPILTKGIQEQQEQIENLQKELQAMKWQLNLDEVQ